MFQCYTHIENSERNFTIVSIIDQDEDNNYSEQSI